MIESVAILGFVLALVSGVSDKSLPFAATLLGMIVSFPRERSDTS